MKDSPMLLVCELRPSGRVHRSDVPENSLEIALSMARKWRAAGRMKIWIEKQGFPSSFQTIDIEMRVRLGSGKRDTIH
jgi:hypothetical protein